ncbi:MAG: Hsp70 family protein, partial [Phycisphaerae bacterium]
MNEPIIGIDLGTTFSLVAYVDERGPSVVRDENGDGRLPSVIGFREDGSSLTIGWEARRRAIENPRNTVYSVKRLIGRGPQDIVNELPFLAYAVQAGPRETVQIDIGGRRFAPEEISALILRELKTRVERELGREVRKAVITVPAYFDDSQRQATRDAGNAAGLEVVRIINEPTAAALAYGIGLRGSDGGKASDGAMKRRSDEVRIRTGRGPVSLPMPKCNDDAADAAIQNPKSKIQNTQQVVVYDLGGGTFDISILRIEGDVCQVLA